MMGYNRSWNVELQGGYFHSSTQIPVRYYFPEDIKEDRGP